MDATDGRAGIDATLVRRLLAEQHPRWSGLPVTPVARDGHDNRTFRLGERLSVRLPTAAGYTAAVAKEHTWLPVLAPHLPLEIPRPDALGRPSALFPRPWSVRRWIEGEPMSTATAPDPDLAVDLADFLVALRAQDTTDAPLAGAHSFHRGGPLATYDAEVREAAAHLGVDVAAVWEAALASRWAGPPVWFHGDVAVGNLLVRSGRLVAVIDFGCCGVGDPACDLVMAWTHFGEEARGAFAGRVALDPGTWARARGWALWKALVTLAAPDTDRAERACHARVLQRVLFSP